MAPLVAVAQITSSAEPQQNYNTISTLAVKAALDSVTLLCLPECFDYIAPSTLSPTISQPLNSPLISRYQSLATHHNIWLSLGGFHEQHPTLPNSHFYNTHLLLSPSNLSTPHAVYRKLHLFDATLPSGKYISEKSNTQPGSSLAIAKNTPFGTIGLSTCYDLRFPALYEALRHAGASLLLVPSAFFPNTGDAHWHVLLRARAIENQCYVAAAAQVGRHRAANRDSYGHALIADPFGVVLADAGPSCAPTYVTARVDADRIQYVRQSMPVIRHRRTDVLGPVANVPDA